MSENLVKNFNQALFCHPNKKKTGKRPSITGHDLVKQYRRSLSIVPYDICFKTPYPYSIIIKNLFAHNVAVIRPHISIIMSQCLYLPFTIFIFFPET